MQGHDTNENGILKAHAAPLQAVSQPAVGRLGDGACSFVLRVIERVFSQGKADFPGRDFVIV